MRIKNKLKIQYILVILAIILSLWPLTKLRFNSDFIEIFPKSETTQEAVDALEKVDFFDRIAFNIYSKKEISPDSLTLIADEFIDSLKTHSHFFKRIYANNIDVNPFELFDAFYDNLPLFMDSSDYKYIESLNYDSIERIVKKNYKSLITPSSLVTSKFTIKDPLNLAVDKMALLNKLKVENYSMYDGYIFNESLKNLIFFIIPKTSVNTDTISAYMSNIDSYISKIENDNPGIKIEYYGAAPIALANKKQIQKDVALTVSIAVVALFLLLIYFFGDVFKIILVFIPPAIAALFSLGLLSVLFDTLSAVSLGIGSVLLGITLDYGLHIITNIKHGSSAREVIKEIKTPLIMSSLTTFSAFYSLTFLSSQAIRQLGMFAAFSIIFTAIIALFVLPGLVKFKNKGVKRKAIERFSAIEFHNKRLLVTVVLVISFASLFFSTGIEFEEDLEQYNFLSPKLQIAEQNLEKVTDSQKEVIVFSKGEDFNKAFKKLKNTHLKLENVLDDTTNEINKIISPDILLLTIAEQKNKINQWNYFWDNYNKKRLKYWFLKAGKNYNMNESAFSSFFGVMERNFTPENPEDLYNDFSSVLEEMVYKDSANIYISSLIKLGSDSERYVINKALEKDNSILLDKKLISENLFSILKNDFNKLINISLILVVIIIFLFFGRFELTFITVFPMLLSWSVAFAIMNLTGIKLNVFNIIVCSLIFGLGIDYSVFITKGYLIRFFENKDKINSFKSSIIISAFTTLIGIGVLIWAKHPALKSIAALAIAGILSVVFISFTIQPLLLKLLFSKSKSNPLPATIYDLFFTLLLFGTFFIGSIFLSVLIIPVTIFVYYKKKRQTIFRYLICYTFKFIVLISVNIRKDFSRLDKDMFKKSSVLVTNHQSMVDLIVLLSLSPKLVILVKDWVWNNPVFGFVVRNAGYLNVNHNNEKFNKILEEQISFGNTIAVFPEGTRTKDGKIKRFHKGAFLIADQHKIPVKGILMDGIYDIFPKSSFIIKPGIITLLSIIDIPYNHEIRNEGYSATSKKICRLFREEYEMRKLKRGPEFYKYQLKNAYNYINPIIENYTKVKFSIENYYSDYNKIIPKKSKITDVGCGVGMMSFALSLFSGERVIEAFDYDENKVNIARKCPLNKSNINFFVSDARTYDYSESDIFIISDVLHYLNNDDKLKVLESCSKNLNKSGKIIIREGDSSNNKHFFTKFSEFFSTKLKFNKTTDKLSFLNYNFLKKFADKYSLDISMFKESKVTSNQIFILSDKN